MAKYVLGEQGMRKFKQLTRGNLEAANVKMNGSSHAPDNKFPHPYEVRWTNSLFETGAISGGYMIWLPDIPLYVNLSAFQTEKFPQVENEEIEPLDGSSETNKWYRLTPSALSVSQTDSWPDEFDIWLNHITTKPTFSGMSATSVSSEPADCVHIAHVKDYRPTPDVKTVLMTYTHAIGDEKSVALYDDGWKKVISSDSGEESSLISVDAFHFYDFYNHNSDLTWEPPEEGTAGGNFAYAWFVVKYRDYSPGDPTKENDPLLKYICWGELYRSMISNVAQDIGNSQSDIHNAVLSAVPVDEQSISRDGDGWGISSSGGMQHPLHMWHFHDSGADVDNPEMCDIVLRYNPGGQNAEWLRYIPYESLKLKLSADIGGGGGGGGGEITPEQLSSIPSPGMFSWTPKTRTMGPGGCMVGRKWYTCTSGIGSGKPDNLYQLRVTIASGGSVSLAVVSDASLGQAPTTTQCWIPIYQITNGQIATDYRGAFVVPAYE